MTLQPDLRRLAREFAAEIQDLLNGTITHGVTMSAVIARHGTITRVPVGFGLTKSNFKPRNIPLTVGSRSAYAELLVAYVTELDPEGEYLMVSKSQIGLYLVDGPTAEPEMLVHWDYERQPAHGYPPAHVQVGGEAPHFERLCELARTRLEKGCSAEVLRDLHFPVGGRRFRPSLEDVIEFLILENLVEYRDDWKDTLDRHRALWEQRQLRAAVRRSPEIAIEQLRADGQL